MALSIDPCSPCHTYWFFVHILAGLFSPSASQTSMPGHMLSNCTSEVISTGWWGGDRTRSGPLISCISQHCPSRHQQASETQHVLLQTPKSGRHTLIHTVLISLFHSFSCSPRIISDFLIWKPRQMNTYILESEKDPGKISVKWARI